MIPPPVNRSDRLGAFFNERLGLDGLRGLAAKKQVPVHRCTHFYYLGGMALFLFLVQIVTGILLSLYYKPSPDQAFESVRAIMTDADPMLFFTRPISGILLLLSAASIAASLWQHRRWLKRDSVSARADDAAEF